MKLPKIDVHLHPPAGRGAKTGKPGLLGWWLNSSAPPHPVEGRNGYLSRLHHSGRGIPTRKLQVLTIIHNFDLKRADGTTAAGSVATQP